MSSCHTRSHPWERLRLSHLRRSVQENEWDALRGQLHTRFDQWLDGLEAQLREPALRLPSAGD